MTLRALVCEAVFAAALLWMLGLGLAIVCGFDSVYVRGTRRLLSRILGAIVRTVKHWIMVGARAAARWLGRRFREW